MSETQGPLDGFEVLQKASLSLEQVQDQSSKYFEQTKRLSLYVEGEIYYQNRDYKKAIKCLESSLDLVEHPSKPDTEEERDLRDEYKNLALWFDEGMQKEEDDVINPLTKQVL